MNTIGKNIRDLRQNQGLSQGQIAHQLGISIPAFSKIETGITDINMSRLQQIADYYGVTVYKLLGNPESEGHQVQVSQLKQKIMEREAEIIELQKKIIRLYGELMPIWKGGQNG